MTKIKYIISTYLSKFEGYQFKKQDKGKIIAYISNIWKHVKNFDEFNILLNGIIIQERYCLERAFQKIRIKGGKCNPCCVFNITKNTLEYLFNI